MKSALDVHRELLARDVPHEMVRLRERVVTADDLPRVLGLPTGCVAVRCYVVTRRSGEEFVAVLVPAGAVPVPGALLDALDASALRAATAAEVNAVTEYAAGLVSPVCLPGDVDVVADAALAANDVVYAAVGEGGLALGIRTAELLRTIGARVTPLTVVPLLPADERTATVIHLDPRGARRGAS